MRGHHQKTHVVDDVLRREQRPVVVGGAAQLREQVFAATLGAADRNLFREVGDDALAAPDAARHRRTRQWLAYHRNRGRHHIDKGAGDLVDLGADIGTEKRGGGKIEGELFHGRIEQDRARLRLPLRDPCGNAGIERGKVGFHRPGFERHRQRAAVQPVLVEIEQLTVPEIAELVGEDPEQVLRISAKTGEGIEAVLDAIVERIPPPAGDYEAPARALVFDSSYDQYRGVVAFVRVVDGSFSPREPLRAMAQGTRFEAEEVGFFSPTMVAADALNAGEVGYVITGLKDVSKLRVGDTLTSERRSAGEPLPGYKDVKPMVFAGLFPTDSDDYPELRDALERLKLNDAALFYEPETSQALGFGFRCGFLGLLHMEIVRERLEREFGLALIATAPSVEYLATLTNGKVVEVDGGIHPATAGAPGVVGGGASLGKLRAVLEVARTLQTAFSMQDVLVSVVDAALSITGSERGFLLLRNDGELEIRVARARGVRLDHSYVGTWNGHASMQ